MLIELLIELDALDELDEKIELEPELLAELCSADAELAPLDCDDDADEATEDATDDAELFSAD